METLPLIDPLGSLTVTAGRDNCFCTCRPSVPLSVRLSHFSKSSKTKQSENYVRYWRDFGSGWVDHWWHLFCNDYNSLQCDRQQDTHQIGTGGGKIVVLWTDCNMKKRQDFLGFFIRTVKQKIWQVRVKKKFTAAATAFWLQCLKKIIL